MASRVRQQKRSTCLAKLQQNEFKSFNTHVQTSLVTNQLVSSCVNTDFWLDEITRESRHTRELRHLLQNKFVLGRWNTQHVQIFLQKEKTTLFFMQQPVCSKRSWFVGGKTCKAAIHLILQQCCKLSWTFLLYVLSYIYNGCEGRETCRSCFYSGGGGVAYNRMYFLFTGRFVYNGGLIRGTGAYKRTGAYRRRFTALQEWFSFSLLFYSIPKS